MHDECLIRSQLLPSRFRGYATRDGSARVPGGEPTSQWGSGAPSDALTVERLVRCLRETAWEEKRHDDADHRQDGGEPERLIEALAYGFRQCLTESLKVLEG